MKNFFKSYSAWIIFSIILLSCCYIIFNDLYPFSHEAVGHMSRISAILFFTFAWNKEMSKKEESYFKVSLILLFWFFVLIINFAILQNDTKHETIKIMEFEIIIILIPLIICFRKPHGIFLR